MLVSSLRDNSIWRLENLQFPIPTHIEQLIQGLPIAQLTKLSDTFVWPQNNNVCSVRPASKFLYQQANVPFARTYWNWIWKLQCPKNIQFFVWKSIRNRLPTRLHMSFSRPEIDNYCPRRNNPETTIHILRDCPWVKRIWYHSPGILPLSFFHLSLQNWLHTNATSNSIIFHYQLPWKIYFTFLCWNLWLARNECIFKKQSYPQDQIIQKVVQCAIEFFFSVCPAKNIKIKIPRIIKWNALPEPFIKLNTDGNSLGNLSLVGIGGLLCNSSGDWISGFFTTYGYYLQ